MSRSQQIRDWMQGQDGPRTSRQIADGTGIGILPVGYSVALMVRDGWLQPHGSSRPMTYSLLRTEKMQRPRQTEAERSARRRKREREREQARQTLSPEQYRQWLADCAKRTKEEKEAAQAEALRLQKLAAEIRAANKSKAKLLKQRQQESAAQDRRDQSRADKARLSDCLAGMNQPAPIVEEWPDSDAFISANPDKYFILQMHEVSTPFQRIGFNNQVMGRD